MRMKQLAAGVDAFLIKGCSAETLLNAILQFSQVSAGEVWLALKVKQID